VYLPAGNHILRAELNTGGYNFNYILVTPAVNNPVLATAPGCLKIFPNPVQDKLYMKLNREYTGTLDIFSSDGILVYTSRYISSGESTLVTDTESLSPGVYTLRWVSPERVGWGRFVKALP